MSDPGPGVLLLVRHGRTPWSATGRHTGLTDVALDEVGEAQAAALGATVRALRSHGDHDSGASPDGSTDGDGDGGPGPAPALVLSSPLARATRTAQLAGLDAWGPIETDDRLVEWDYGPYEGLTTDQIRARRGDHWRALRDGVTDPLPDLGSDGAPGDGPADGSAGDQPAPHSAGESLEHLAARARAVLDRVQPALQDGDVVLVGHGHALRVLAATWLELPAHAAERLQLEAAAVSVLAHEHGVPGLRRWNVGPGLLSSP